MKSSSKKLAHADTTSWLIESRQIWKLYVALAGFGLTLLCFLIGAFSLVSGVEQFWGFVVCGMLLGILTLIWMVNVLRCPHCQCRLVWTMIKSRSHTTWLIDLVALQTCPTCSQTLRFS